MNAEQFTALLNKLDACEPAKQWAAGKTLAEVWNTCERGDWLLWLAHKMSGKKGWPNRKAVVLACCACAETALTLVPEGENRPLIAIQTARRWAVGQATDKELDNAAAGAARAAGAAWAAGAAGAARAAGAAGAAILKQSADIIRRHLVIPESK